MRKFTNIVIYFVVGIIVVASFNLPEFILKMENQYMEMAVYEKEKISNRLDVEAEKIYLVKAIHEMEEGSVVEFSLPNQMLLWQSKVVDEYMGITEKIYEEMKKLKDYQLLQEIPIVKSNQAYHTGIIYKNYLNGQNKYTVENILLDVNETTRYLMNVESKTGKLIYMALDKENICTKEDKQLLLQNYIQYLNLYVIEDWQYMREADTHMDKMVSEKARLMVTLEESEKSYMFSTHVCQAY